MANMQPISKSLGPTPECLSLDALVVSLEREQGAFRQAAEAHLVTCLYCQTELAMYREFQSAAPRTEEQAAVRQIVARLQKNQPLERVPWWKAFGGVKVWAPASLALAAAVIMLTLGIPGQHGAGPDVSGEVILRSARISVVVPPSTVRESPSVFEWQPVEGAASYQMRLFEVDNTPLWSAQVREPKAELPSAIRARLTAPKALNWSVTAMNAAGTVIGESGTQRFSIAR